jgi:hypothetical protein
VRLAERERQPILGRGHQNEVDMVGHEAIRPHRDAGLGGAFGEEIAVQRIVAVLLDACLWRYASQDASALLHRQQ